MNASPRSFRNRVAVAARVAGRTSGAARPGFSLIDVLVSLAVIMVLLGILMPSLSAVRETSRRVICASNLRQHALGLAMYAEDHEGFLPDSRFAKATPSTPGGGPSGPQNMVIVRTGLDAWDGLGTLFSAGYLNAPGVFYCPSNKGSVTLRTYQDRWNGDEGDIVAGYHYRSRGPGGETLTLTSRPARAIAADALRSQSDLNHDAGLNVLSLDMSVTWFSDPSGALLRSLPTDASAADASQRVTDAWRIIDADSASKR